MNPRHLLRLFFAAWPDGPARDALARLAHDTAMQRGGRATPPQNLHLTVAFLGNLPPESCESLCTLARAVALRAQPCPLLLDRPGAAGRGDTAWIEASGRPDPLLRLHERLGEGLRAQGLVLDARQFRPHVTLARDCLPALAPPALPAPIGWQVDELVLNASEPARGGSRYATLGSWPLGNAAG
jgi:2'-5' RNA ligase